jgi:hypothetical protein
MNKVLSPVLHKGVEVFVDDNLVHAETEEDLLLLLEQVFKLLAHYGIRLNAKKCAFMVPKVEFLGHDLTANGVSVSPTRLEALRNLPQPQTVRQLRQFMGSFNYIRDYLKDFSIVAQPLFRLISGPGKGVKATPDSSSMATDPVEQEERLARPLARGSREQPRPKFSAAVSLRV